MTDNLSTLFSQSWKSYMKHIVSIVIGALVFGVILAAVSVAFGRSVQGEVTNTMQSLGMDPAQLQALQQRVQQGDAQALVELQNAAQQATNTLGQKTTGDVVTQTGANIYGFSTGMSIAFVIMFLIGLVYQIYLFLLALEEQPAGATMGHIAAIYLPFLGLSLWTMLCSFIWIPFLGIIIGIFTIPRLILSPVIFLKEKTGVFASVKQSFKRTSGYWGKIFGNLLVVGVCMIVASIVTGIIAMFTGPTLSPFVSQFLMQIVMAYAIFFVVKLSLTVMANPKAA